MRQSNIADLDSQLGDKLLAHRPNSSSKRLFSSSRPETEKRHQCDGILGIQDGLNTISVFALRF